LQLFAEAVGNLSIVRALMTPANWSFAENLKDAARKMTITITLEPLELPIDEAGYRRAFASMQRDHIDGVMISGHAEQYTNRVVLGRLAQEYRLPAISYYFDTTKAGALMSYGFELEAEARRLAAQTVEILNGGNPAEMPFFLETHWDLVINLKAAEELGLKVPTELVAQADSVIE
jgi:putative ABC transport system substrate-binding protein